MPGGPKWCERVLILYRTPYCTQIKVNKTFVVTVCRFRIFNFEQFCKTKTNRFIATNNCSGRYSEIVSGRYFSIVAR